VTHFYVKMVMPYISVTG